MKGFTLIVPYYRNPAMLALQAATWRSYPEAVRIVVVDDGSPEPAESVLREQLTESMRGRVSLYRIAVDIPWNRGGARNLGATVASTDWILHVDIDHLLPAPAAAALLQTSVDPRCWYRFARYRVGAADATRRKDKIPPRDTFGAIHPHVDSYLCTRELYWRAGGYNENFSGCLGGGSPFLQQLSDVGQLQHLTEPVCLHVYTRDAVPDASDLHLSRDTSEYSRRRRDMERTGTIKGANPCRFEWQAVAW